MTPGKFSGSMSTYGAYYPKKGITVVCQATDHSCILNGENSRRVVEVDGGVSSGTTNLIGLKIKRGSVAGNGAGIVIVNSDVTITNFLIRKCGKYLWRSAFEFPFIRSNDKLAQPNNTPPTLTTTTTQNCSMYVTRGVGRMAIWLSLCISRPLFCGWLGDDQAKRS